MNFKATFTACGSLPQKFTFVGRAPFCIIITSQFQLKLLSQRTVSSFHILRSKTKRSAFLNQVLSGPPKDKKRATMTSCQLSIAHAHLFIILLLNLFCTCFSQTCEANVVVTSEASLKKQLSAEITRLFDEVTCLGNSTSNSKPENFESTIERIKRKLDGVNERISNLEKKLDMLHLIGMTM